jgi:hypothetical protein
MTRLECKWLEKNFRTCLREKAVKDKVDKMECNIENVGEVVKLRLSGS